MNSAYLSSWNFTESSTRACMVAVFGFLGCDFRIAIGFFFSSFRFVLRVVLQTVCSDRMHAAKRITAQA